MTNRRRIYVDFDDVLCETALEFTRVLDSEFGKRVAFEDIFSFDLSQSFGLSGDEVHRLMRLTHEPDVLLRMEPVPGALETLSRWAAGGTEVSVVTGRPSYTREASIQWLKAHAVPFAELHFVDKYARESDAAFRREMLTLDQLAGMDFCLAVEDSPRMVRFLAERTRIPVAVLHRPWNASGLDLAPEAGQRVFRCHDWPHLRSRFPAPGGEARSSL
jgi:uncharacterized protein